MYSHRPIIWRGMVALFLAFLYATAGLAGEAFVLRLGTEGSATVVLSRESRTAFITDGGRKSGLVGATINGETVADMLLRERINHLVVTCSHPHDDHLSGLVEFLTSDDVLRVGLRRIDFVESGYGEKSLHKIYETYWRQRPQRPPVSTPHTAGAVNVAKQSNAFKEIGFAAGMTVGIRNLEYEAKDNASPHGRSVVVIYEIQDGSRTTRVVDFDDADSNVVSQYIAWLREDNNRHLEARKPDVVIMPHHGTSLAATDVTGLFVEDIRPRDVIFTVNDENRYLHPHPDTVAYCLRTLTTDHVHFTAGSRNVVITGNGVQRAAASSPLAVFLQAVNPKVARIDATVSGLREKLAAGQQLTDKEKRFLEKHEPWLDGMFELKRKFDDPNLGGMPVAASPKRPILPPNLGGFQKLTAEAREMDRRLIAENHPIPPAIVGGRPYSKPTSTSSGGFRGGSARFLRMFRLRPVFGGVTIGNSFDSTGHTATAAKIQALDDDGITSLVIRITSTDSVGNSTEAVYDRFTPTELWCALRFVDSTEVNREFALDLDAQDCGLVGIRENDREVHDAWFFGIHPAIANTKLAQDAMRLDMMLSALEHEDVLEGIELSNYQWCDDACRIGIEQGRIVVSPSSDPQDTVLRIRIWGRTRFDRDLEVEVANRVQKAAEKERLTKVPLCVMALWAIERASVLDTLRKEMERDTPSPPQSINELNERQAVLETKLEEARTEYYKRMKITDAPSVILEHLLRTAIEQARDDLANKAEGDEIQIEVEAFYELVGDKIIELAKQNNIAGLEDSAAYKLWKVYASYQYQLNNTATDTSDAQEVRHAMRGAVQEFARDQGLEDDDTVRIWMIILDAREEVAAELTERNLEVDTETVLNAMPSDFEPFRRLDRFARLVAVLRWVKEDTGALPGMSNDAKIVPLRMNVPPVFFFQDVFGYEIPIQQAAGIEGDTVDQ